MKTKSSRRTLAMTLLSNDSLLALTLLKELLSTWKSPPILVEGGREWLRLSYWAPKPKVGFDDKGSNEAI